MPLDQAQSQVDMLSQLSAQGPPGGGPAPQQPGAPMAGSQTGGPGVDTPEEQQAVQLLMQGMQFIRQAAGIDRSIRPLVDKILPDAFLQFAQHYGYGEEGKLALKQAQMMQSRERGAVLQGQGPMKGPPGPVGQPRPPNPETDSITY